MTFQPPPFLQGIEKSMIRKISDRAKPGSISLGLGEPDLPTPEVIVREAVRVIQEEKNGYTLQAGLPALRERIASDIHIRHHSTKRGFLRTSLTKSEKR